MAEKTMLEKAAEAVGFGMAMAEDVAGSIKNAVGAAVTTDTGVLAKSPAKKAPVKKTGTKVPAKKIAPKKASKGIPEKDSEENGGKESRKKSIREEGS